MPVGRPEYILLRLVLNQIPEVVELPKDLLDVFELPQAAEVVEQDHGGGGDGRLQLEEGVQTLLSLSLR